MSNIIVISPHPDDESIGCGGTLHKHVMEGDAVHAVFLTSGEQGGHGRPADATISVREREAQEAADLLGLESIEFWREPDGAVRAEHPLVERLLAKLIELKPKILYVTHEDEMHPDHRAAVRLVKRALEQVATRPTVLMYEVWTPLQTMDHIEDISDHIEVKLAAIRAHRSQCAVLRFDEAILGLNRYRGEMHSWPGGPYAEVFRHLIS